jgi:DNA repair protein RadD
MLRWYQQEAVNSLFQYFYSGAGGNPVLAMPTGSGKSHVIAGFAIEVFRNWSNQRIMVATHRKELVKQDYDKLVEAWPLAPAGIYSAGLKQKDTNYPIIFGGIASIVRNIEAFGHIDLLFVDECHLVSDDEESMYQRLITELKKRNPWLKIIGLSATIFRLGMGYLTEGKLFTHIAYDCTSIEKFNRLVEEGWLCRLIPRKTDVKLDVSDVSMQRGDYNQGELQKAVNKDEITWAALNEAREKASDRRRWLVFSTGIEHCERISQMLTALGISSTFVHSKVPREQRDKRISDFKKGYYNALVNANILTTGFDDPAIDCLIILRPTCSPVLWVQILGRGTRPYETKDNTLVLDYAGNTYRLGPINDPRIPNPKSKLGGPAPVKTCDHCGTINHITVRYCIGCGAEFDFAVKIEQSASDAELIRADLPIVETFDVRTVIINRHCKDGSVPVMEVDYYVHGRKKPFKEWVCLQHTGLARAFARDWWRKRHHTEPPETTDEALKFQSELRKPVRINVHVNLKYPKVLGWEWQ